MATIVKSIAKKSNNSSLYISNQFFPLLCVFIIAKVSTILLASFALGYIVLFQPKKKKFIANRENKMLEAAPPLTPPPQPHPSLSPEQNNEDDLLYNYSSDEEDENLSITPRRSLSLMEDNNSSIEFESLMKFPSCPTTLPRLDTHFNFVTDHDIQSPDPTKINWPAIHQEMEYDQQRQEGIVKQEQQQQLEESPFIQPQHPLLLLHQLQQDNTSMIFSEDEFSSICTSSKPTSLDDAAILYVDNDIQYNYYQEQKNQEQQQEQQMKEMIHIEDLLILPQPKPSISSPGQLFKSKFQKAVSKIKKNSNLVHYKQNSGSSKRSSVVSNGSSTKSEPLRSNFDQDPSILSPRPSASARVHDHLKGRFNKIFKK